MHSKPLRSASAPSTSGSWPASWSYTEADGTELGQRVDALQSVGLYVPGGLAAYPSSVLMNALPAQVAGVETHRDGRTHSWRRA